MQVGEQLPATLVVSDAIVDEVALDAAGNRYVVGYMAGNVRFGTITLSCTGNLSDIFVAKIDPAGNYLWAVRAGDPAGNETASSIAIDALGNAYIIGLFSGPTMTIGTTVLTNNSPTQTSETSFVAKLSASGQWLWATRFGTSGKDVVHDIAVDVAGNAFLTGSFSSPQLAFGATVLSPTAPSITTLFVAKTDPAGNYLWAVRGGGGRGVSGQDITIDALGNSYIAGSTSSPSTVFGTLTLTHTGSGQAVLVAKLSPTGNYLWVTKGGGNGPLSETPTHLALGANGNTYVAGNFQNNGAQFGTTALPNAGGDDIFVAQLDGAGNWGWAARAGGASSDGSSGLVADQQGGVYVTGYYWNAALTIGSTTLPYQGLFDDGFLAKLDASTGAWRWATRMGGSLNDVGLSLALDTRNNLHVAGYYQSPLLSLPPLTLPGVTSGAGGSGFLTTLATDPRVRIGGDSLLCGAGTQLTATGPAPIVAYRWSTGATTPTITATQPGLYSVTVTFGSGLTSTTQFRVVAFASSASISGDSLLCPGASTLLTALGAGSGATYQWSTGATTPAIPVTQPGTYSVTIRYGTACSATAQHTVRLPTLRLTGDTQLCGPGSSLVLTAAAPGSTALRWNTGATTPSLAVGQAGTYSVVATFSNGCLLIASQVVTRATLSLSGDTVLCPGRSSTLTAGFATPATYQWSTGATTASIAVTQPGIYTVTAHSTLPPFCVTTSQLRVRASQLLAAFTLGADTTLCDYQSLLLHAPALGALVTYRWSDGSAGATLRVAQPGTYTLRISTPCEERTASRRVAYQSCLLIPNVITPNEDHLNDRFVIQGLAPGAWALTIYNRWGRQAFTTPAYAHDWGHDAAPGLYYYLLRQANVTYKGWLEVVR